MANNIIGERIAGLLREQGKSQRELAEQVGTTRVSIFRYIKGDRVPKGPVLANIAKALHTTTDYLLGNEQDSNDPDLEYNCTLPEKVAVFDISEIVKRINEDKNMSASVQSVYQIVEEFSKKYYIALIPKKVLDENSDYSTHLLKKALLNNNVVVKDYLCNSEYANSMMMNGLCLTLLNMLMKS